MKRIIKGSETLDRGYYALNNCYNALHTAYRVLSEYEDNIEQILDDPTFYERLVDEVRYLETQVDIYTAQ